MSVGYLSIVLHAHLPYVHHPAQDHRIEERWLHEAITETYIPLLRMMQRLRNDGIVFQMTISITPTLLAMLSDPDLQMRYLGYISQLIQLAHKEIARTENSPAMQQLAKHYLNQFIETQSFFIACDGCLLHAFQELQDEGYIELITSAATHAFLPLTLKKESVRAQIVTGREEFFRHFGKYPKGIWLPECGYTPAWEEVLQETGVEYFFIDSHGISQGHPDPEFGVHSPSLTPKGIAAFARDPSSSLQIWSSKQGYPGDFDYREFYRDIGYDLDIDYVRPYIHPSGIRLNTGIKYYRITGESDHKEIYDPVLARAKADLHADHFIREKLQQVSSLRKKLSIAPLITAPFDAELFGHWWYEGPIFLDLLFRKLHLLNQELQLITPTGYLKQRKDLTTTSLSMSSWGRQGYAEVWLNDLNDWIYPALHFAEDRMIQLADRHKTPSALTTRALNQAARELMLAQSSDWAFIMDGKTTVEYAVERTKTHINRFTHLYHAILNESLNESLLLQMEQEDPLFPNIQFDVYRTPFQRPTHYLKEVAIESPKKVLFLSWEYPPMTVGGLSRHVYDLSRYLTGEGWEVHVVTTEVDGVPLEEIVERVHVHRVPVRNAEGGEFIHWVLQMNLSMIDYCTQACLDLASFSLIHAHDWLVFYAAKALKEYTKIPLITTIHATEYGRNNGIHTAQQSFIHNLEQQLIHEASRIIVCSTYMQKEVEHISHMNPDIIDMIPNGVDPRQLSSQINHSGNETFTLPHGKIVLFLGRMVYEKGVRTLLDAIPEILTTNPDTQFIFTGEGPMRYELEERSKQLGISSHVIFTGFVTDQFRNTLLSNAAVAVFPSLYEPFGIVAIEAMAAGTPVVVSDVGGLSDIVTHELNGLKAYPGDVQSFVQQIQRLLSAPEWAKTLASIAKLQIHRYDWQQIAKETSMVYMRVLHENTNPVNTTRSLA